MKSNKSKKKATKKLSNSSEIKKNPKNKSDFEKIVVSSCLLGTPCRYDGKDQKRDFLVRLMKDHPEKIISVCPEVLGGLSTPRVPCERKGKKVVSKLGKDETEAYRLGAERALSEIITADSKAEEKLQSALLNTKPLNLNTLTSNTLNSNALNSNTPKKNPKAKSSQAKPQISCAYLKSKSPMCGCGKIYDGNFTGKLIDGNGVFVDALKKLIPKIKIEPVD